jgi:hypothetical protein
MDTYSIAGAEDSEGLSGCVPSYFNADVIYPQFESIRLVSDFNFAGLFANFEQTTRSDTEVPILWGGVLTASGVDPNQTVPPTYGITGNTAAALADQELFPVQASRFQRLGLYIPGQSISLTQPIWSSYSQTYYYAIHQQFESTSTLWCPIDAIVVTSGNIPLKKELLADPTWVPQSSPASTGGQQSSQNTAQILTDFSLDLKRAQDYRSFILYVPTSEYRRISLRESGLFQTISFALFWRSRVTQNLLPVTLSSGGSCNLKFLFEPL